MESLKRNLLIMGVPHSGTTIVAAMINALGWKYEETEYDYKRRWSHRWFINVNSSLIGHETGRNKMNEEKLKAIPGTIFTNLERMPKPFFINDTRLIFALKHWHCIIEKYNPILILITREKERLRHSFKRRSQYSKGKIAGKHGKSVLQLTEYANKSFEEWPGDKFTLNYTKISDAIELFDTKRKYTKSPNFGKSGI